MQLQVKRNLGAFEQNPRDRKKLAIPLRKLRKFEGRVEFLEELLTEKSFSRAGNSNNHDDMLKQPRGDRMTRGTGWRLATKKGRKRQFVGSLLQTLNIGSKRIAIFSVRK